MVRWPIFVLRTNLSLGHATMQPYWCEIAWSVNHIFHGLFPSVSSHAASFARGTDAERNASAVLADGLVGAVTEFRGDWKYHKQVWRLRVGWRNRYICHVCEAARVGDAHLFTDFSETAQWRNTVRTFLNFMRDCLPQEEVCAAFA
jgi:hypothetical protein